LEAKQMRLLILVQRRYGPAPLAAEALHKQEELAFSSQAIISKAAVDQSFAIEGHGRLSRLHAGSPSPFWILRRARRATAR